LQLGVGAVATAVTPIGNETPFKKLKDGLVSIPSTDEGKDGVGFDINENESSVSITVVGASGDLAKKKIFPALFALYYEDCLPKVLHFF
jgi:glucose-6-phosphate 1-dehydrogenase